MPHFHCCCKYSRLLIKHSAKATPHTAKGKIKSKNSAKDNDNGKDYTKEENTLIKIMKTPSEDKESGANQDYSGNDVEEDTKNSKANKAIKTKKAIKEEHSPKESEANQDYSDDNEDVEEDIKDNKPKKAKKAKKKGESKGLKDLDLSRG